MKKIFFGGDIDGASGMYLCQTIHDVLEEDKNEKILIYICSSGGELEAVISVCDYINNIKKSADISICASGMCASGALCILLTADKRFATKNTLFMWHKGNVSFDSYNANMAMEYIKINETIFNKFFNAIIESSGVTKEFIKDISNKEADIWFNTKKATSYGVIEKTRKIE